MLPTKSELIEWAKEFDTLEYKCRELSHEPWEPRNEWFEELIVTAAKAYDLWVKIRFGLGGFPKLSVSDKRVQETLRKIRDDEDLLSVRQYIRIAKYLNLNLDDGAKPYLTDLLDESRDRFDDLFSEFHEWFDIPNYYYSIAQIGCILGFGVYGNEIDDYFIEIREAYAFGLYGACVALSRALIELVLFDALKRKRLLKEAFATDVNTGQKNIYLARMIQTGKRHRIISREQADKAHRIRKGAIDVLHIKTTSRDKVEKMTAAKALEVVRDTVAVIEGILSSRSK